MQQEYQSILVKMIWIKYWMLKLAEIEKLTENLLNQYNNEILFFTLRSWKRII